MKSTKLFRFIRFLGVFIILAGLPALQPLHPAQAAAASAELKGPAGSGQFGYSVTVLPNGNLVVVDPYYDEKWIKDVGAVYLYHGETDELISKLTGSSEADQVGISGILVLPNGQFLVLSANWNNASAGNAGAITRCSSETGCSGTVSAANSLVGGRGDDQVGNGGITLLRDGSYIVRSSYWDNDTLVDAGAVTWCSGETGCTGKVSEANSLVGGRPGDRIGLDGIMTLRNGNFVVRSSFWDNNNQDDAGAVTWCSGEIGCSGVITTTNSLVGGLAWDRVGGETVVELANGSYVVASPAWDRKLTGVITPTLDVGAVTWCDGETGCTGEVSPANSLVGGADFDRVGSRGVTPLPNTNYLVASPNWDWIEGRARVYDSGAVTYCRGEAGCTGEITSQNSLVSSTNADQAGSRGITLLVNGNYVVNTPTWDDPGAPGTGAPDAGAVTWCDGETGCSGAISPSNSLVGSTYRDRVGFSGVFELANGNYIISSVSWDNRLTYLPGKTVKVDMDDDGEVEEVDVLVAGAMQAGAITWCDGEAGCTGAISAQNSLVGTQAGDQLGSAGLVLLPNTHYLVRSPTWDYEKIVDSGAVTWCSGESGCTGPITLQNSLVGGNPFDRVGSREISVLINANYVVNSYDWDKGSLIDLGAVTWCAGETGCAGLISAENSLVGEHTYDRTGKGGVVALPNGNYAVLTPNWDLDKVWDVGAVTWCVGETVSEAGCQGPISVENSLVGSRVYDFVGSGGIAILANSHFVVRSPDWDHGLQIEAGAATWCDGQVGCAMTVSPENSLVGGAHYDRIGNGGVVPLMNGSYVVLSPYYNTGPVFDVGAATWCSGEAACAGQVSAANSLVGERTNDRVGSGGVVGLPNDTYLVLSPTYNSGPKIIDAGALSTCSNDGGGEAVCVGLITEANSLIGALDHQGPSLAAVFNQPAGRLILIQPKFNLMSIYN